MDIGFLIIGLVLSLVSACAIGYLIYQNVKVRKGEKLIPKADLYYGLASLIGLAVGGLFLILSALYWPRDGEGHTYLEGGIPALSAIFSFFWFLGMGCFAYGFAFHFYKPDLDKKQGRCAHIGLYAGAAVAVLGFLLTAEGISRSDYFSYPLMSSISLGNLHIAFYGILIVLGALLAYELADHRMYQYSGEHGLLDSTLLVGFPSGIIGARIGYVIGNWDLEFASRVAKGDWTCIFAIWEGGLTILGGAIAGIVCGALWFHWRHPKIGGRFAIDMVIPGILLAQAVGRWGNFFNQEVYGSSVDSLSFLPYWLAQNMYIDGAYRVPLFLVEGILNVAGYFLIWYGVRNLFKKYLHYGDMLGCYLIWYGVIRFILEPLRDSSFNMGNDGNWSIIWSALYVVMGILWMVIIRLFDYWKKKKGKPAYEPEFPHKLKASEKTDSPEEANIYTYEEDKHEEN
ncbi:MAG: prolipoprotein diacylglyceryl transferase [Bacillota bacterium]|nr:prolipoprotein diacylglyceryl transferase [Bacillota bacterium]